MRKTLNQRPWISLSLLILVAFLCSCASKSEKEGVALYKEAKSLFEGGEYDQTIANITKALELTNDGESTMTIAAYFYNGEVHLLRAQAYDALGKRDNAIEDYRIAVKRGNEYISSYALNSNPKPGAKANWFRKYSGFYNLLGMAYAKDGKYEDALVSFMKAIGVAGGSVDRVDTIDKLVGTVFGGETDKRQAFAKVVGAYCYNAGIMEKKLGRASDAMAIARRLGYDRTLIVESK